MFVMLFFCHLACNVTRHTNIYREEFVSPESQGVDAEKLNEALAFLESKSFEDGLNELVIVRNGKIIFKADSVYKVHNIYSCSKAFTSTVAGLLIDEGRIALDQKVADIDSTLRDLYPNATFRHFLTMTSGYSGKGRSRWNDENSDWSWTPYEPEAPHFMPGQQYEYWDEAQMQLGRILTMVLKGTMKEYLDTKVFQYMDFGTWNWYPEQDVDDIEINNGCTNVHVNAMQLAKVGQLFLNRGKWNGRQLIPEQWCRQATRSQVEASIPVFDGDRSNVKGSGSYGFNWWVNSKDGLSRMPDAPLGVSYMSGLNHNVCFIVPEWDMVIIRMGDDKNPPEGKHVVWNKFLGILSAGIQ